MSWYYSYYIGVMDESGKIYPYGPYNSEGELKPVVVNSRSFDYGFHDGFVRIRDEVTDELKTAIYGQEIDDLNDYDIILSFKPLSEIGSTEYVKKGYFLLKDIDAYLKGEDYYDNELFLEMLTPEVFAAKLLNESVIGNIASTIEHQDDDEYQEKARSASEYGYFAYKDTCCKEYYGFLCKEVAYMLAENYEYKDKKLKPVIILSEG